MRQEWRNGGLKFSSYFYIRELVKHITYICYKYLFVDLPFKYSNAITLKFLLPPRSSQPRYHTAGSWQLASPQPFIDSLR